MWLKKIVYFFFYLWDCPKPYKAINRYRALPWYFRDRKEYKRQQKSDNNLFPIDLYYPCLLDKHDTSGSRGYGFWQDLYVARKVYANNPVKHVDIGSSVKSFIAHVCIFREIEVLDIRPQVSNIKNIKFVQADFMNENPELENYCDSVSSLHTMEHLGLGRYNDPVDVNGYLKGLANVYQILRSGGKFYFSVPIGKQRTEFNAHRVFSIAYLLELFKDKYQINEFSYVNDNDEFFENAELSIQNITLNFGCRLGCGIFELTKI